MEVAAEARALLGDGARPVELLLALLRLDVEDLEQLHRQHAEDEPDHAAHHLQRQAGGVEPPGGVADAARRDRPAGDDQAGDQGVGRQRGGRGGRVGADAGHAGVAQLAALAPEADRREDRAREEQRVARERDDRGLPLGGGPAGRVRGEGAAGHDAGGHEDRERRERGAHDRPQAEQAEPELHQEEEGRHLDDAPQHHQGLDGALAEVALLDGHERVAPDRQRLDEREAGQPDQRGRQGQARRAAALQPDGEAEREEDQPLREQDDGLVLDEELAHACALGMWRETPRRAGTTSDPRPPHDSRETDPRLRRRL